MMNSRMLNDTFVVGNYYSSQRMAVAGKSSGRGLKLVPIRKRGVHEETHSSSIFLERASLSDGNR